MWQTPQFADEALDWGIKEVGIGVGRYEVNGLEFEKRNYRADRPYRVLCRYRHCWKRRPDFEGALQGNPSSLTIKAQNGRAVAEVTSAGAVLLPGFTWDGSTGSKDTMFCIRASALHDVWCQAMRKRLYEMSYKNWWRGASEYRRACVHDGMNQLAAWRRYLGLCCSYPFFNQARSPARSQNMREIAQGEHDSVA